jgi:hypothetical protein
MHSPGLDAALRCLGQPCRRNGMCAGGFPPFRA